MYTNSTASSFATNTPMCSNPTPSVVAGAFNGANGNDQPPRNSVTISDDITNIAAYSPIMNMPNFIELYSVLYPPTSSCSASGKSNGSRLVSANALMPKMKNESG